MTKTAEERLETENWFREDEPFEAFKDKYEKFLDGMSAEVFALFEDRAEHIKLLFKDVGTDINTLIEASVSTYKGDNLPAATKYMCYAAIYSGVSEVLVYEAFAANFYRFLEHTEKKLEQGNLS